MNIRGVVLVGMAFVLLALPSCGRKDAGLYHQEVSVKGEGGGKDLIMKFNELERHEKYSLVRVSRESGASVPSIMFVVKGCCEMAKLRGVGYFINLKEWPGAKGEWLYKIGFSADRAVDPKTWFDTDVDPEKDLDFMSVKDFDLIWAGDNAP